MNRPNVTVVMPFAGDRTSAQLAIGVLRQLDVIAGDELILADNSGTVPADESVTVIRATGERSPARARNVGAAHCSTDWILFLDADCRVGDGLLDAYFSVPIPADVGALAGEVAAAPPAATLASRYAAHKSFLNQEEHLAHPYRPRAAAANLLVRRAAFEQVGGFYEGVRAAEDTDFSWRLQQAGWRLELRREARVEHVYRASLRELRRQWRGYAAGRAWLARRYDGFEPELAVQRALPRGLHRRSRGAPADTKKPSNGGLSRLEAGRYAALDAVLAAEELAGMLLSNRPTREQAPPDVPARTVLVAERFPAPGDPLVDFARTLDDARVEAAARPDSVDRDLTSKLNVRYREDDGAATRLLALAGLIARHPVRCALDLARRRAGAPKLSALAPVVRRLQQDPGARLHPLGGTDARATAERLAALTGRPLAR